MMHVMNMQFQTMTLNQPAAAAPQSNRRASFALPALLRLALLAVPLTLTIVTLGQTPLICLLACVAVLSLWLTVDVGPFRAGGGVRPATRQVVLANPRNLSKMQWWNGLFCRAILLLVVVHSKLSI